MEQSFFFCGKHFFLYPVIRLTRRCCCLRDVNIGSSIGAAEQHKINVAKVIRITKLLVCVILWGIVFTLSCQFASLVISWRVQRNALELIAIVVRVLPSFLANPGYFSRWFFASEFYRFSDVEPWNFFSNLSVWCGTLRPALRTVSKLDLTPSIYRFFSPSSCVGYKSCWKFVCFAVPPLFHLSALIDSKKLIVFFSDRLAFFF